MNYFHFKPTGLNSGVNLCQLSANENSKTSAEKSAGLLARVQTQMR